MVPKLDFSKLTSDASPSASGNPQQQTGPLLLPAPGDVPGSASSDEHHWGGGGGGGGGGGQQQALVPADEGDSHFYVYKTMQPEVGAPSHTLPSPAHPPSPASLPTRCAALYRVLVGHRPFTLPLQ
jgi:hypothetical protein